MYYFYFLLYVSNKHDKTSIKEWEKKSWECVLLLLLDIQSTPVILRQLGAKIRERELNGSPVISRESPKLVTSRIRFPHCDLLNPNSMLSDNGCTYISRISADVDIAPATNHNKPYYILIIMHQNLSNYMLHKAAYDGICVETIQTTMQIDRKRK